VGVDCVSPASHGAFSNPVEMMQFIDRLRRLSGGKPTGFKLCIGHPWEWFAICKAMLETGILPDFIVVDGADWCNAARGFMFALGCIQAQTCHTGSCPTGVTTQDPKRQQALVVPTKTERVWRFHQYTLQALKELVQAAGLGHPNQITASHIVRRMADNDVRLLANQLSFVKPGSLLAATEGRGDWPHNVFKQYWPLAQAHSFQPV
jgi:glutamate synthase domain-containing protein 2